MLVCRPDYYGIEYEINPWMSRSRNAVPEEARRQWLLLQNTMQDLGFRIEQINPVRGLPDLVFTANAGIVRGRRFVAGRFKHVERQGESVHFERWFKERGYEVCPLPAGVHFEGEGDGLFLGDVLFAGYRIRSDLAAHARMGELAGARVVSLGLVDPRFYHLDTCFCPLDDRSALYYPPAFPPESREVIEREVPELIPVGDEDALRFACNAIVAGKDVVLNAGCERTRRLLEARGYRIHEVPLSEFIKAGGSAKCLILWLHRPPP